MIRLTETLPSTPGPQVLNVSNPFLPLHIHRSRRADPFHTHAQTKWNRFLGALLPFYGVMCTLDQIAILSQAVSSLAAETSAALALIGKEMSEIRLYTLQNRMALDYVLAATGGVCKVIGPECCITIDDFSGKISNITKEINQTGQDAGNIIFIRAEDYWIG
uniref:ERVV2 protein n=1 Tax=Callorhinchus milii TaxID=7868 RepID=A0A4W3GS60_CALMI